MDAVVVVNARPEQPPSPNSVVTFNDDGKNAEPRSRGGVSRHGYALRRINSIDSSLTNRNAGTRRAAPTVAKSSSGSTCAEPNHEELLMSVGSVLHRRIEENERLATKREVALFQEDTHTRRARPDTFEVAHPLLLSRTMSMPTIFGVRKLPQPAPTPLTFHVPTVETIVHFLQNIWRKARLTPHCVIICLVYVDRLEAKSDSGVLIHARSWRAIIFSALLLASKVWHDISYWNSDFSTICPMFNIRNVNKLERCILELLQYDTIISSSQYAQYYFSLRQASLSQQHGNLQSEDSGPSKPDANFRTKLMMRVGVPAANQMLRSRSISLMPHLQQPESSNQGAPQLRKRESYASDSDHESAPSGSGPPVLRLATSAPQTNSTDESSR